MRQPPSASPSMIAQPASSDRLDRRPRGLGLALLALLAATPTPTLAASLRLSDGLPFSDVSIEHATHRPRVSADGLYAVYVHDAVVDNAWELWSVPLAGGDPVRLSGLLPASAIVEPFALAADSQTVVYRAPQDSSGVYELYSAPIAGPAGSWVKLNPELVAGGNVLEPGRLPRRRRGRDPNPPTRRRVSSTMTDPVLSLDSVSKRFAGRTAVERLSFDVAAGEIFALLGPNGAGKTTTVRMLTGILAPDEGRIEVRLDGIASHQLPPARSGYLPEERGLYREIPVLRTLVYFGMLRGLARAEATRRAEAWLERLELLDRRHERVDALSKGNQQRVQLIAAVLHQPAIAILDEPFTGLDPLSQERFLALVRELAEGGMTILLSAHQMDLVERVADRLLLLNHGRTILAGAVAELRAGLADETLRLHDVFVRAVREDDHHRGDSSGPNDPGPSGQAVA